MDFSKKTLPKRWVGLTLIAFGLFALLGVILLFITFWQQLYYWPYTDPPRLGQVIVFGIIGIVTVVFGLFSYLLVQSMRKKEINLVLYRINLIFGLLALIGGFVTIGVAAPNYQYTFYDSAPYLSWKNTQSPTNSITVSWHSAIPSSSTVRYGLSPSNLSWTAVCSDISYYHHVSLENLLPDTIYYYSITGFHLKQFRTAPIDARNFTFCVFSDPRTNNPPESAVNQVQITQYISQSLASQHISPAFTLFTGDGSSRGVDYIGWKYFLDDITLNSLASNSSLVYTIGNHERHDDNYARNFPKYFPYENFTYSLDYGQLHITSIDNWNYSAGWWGAIDSQLESWIENDLIRHNSSKFKILSLHENPVSNGQLNNDIFPTIDRLCRTYHVDAVFFGHDHHYEANLINGTYYFMLGFGGNSNMGDYTPGKASFQLDGGSHQPGFCQVDMTPNSMHIRPQWMNGTWMTSYLITK